MTNNDQTYIDKIIKGDASAFAVLVDRYKDLVYGLCIKMLRHTENAEEAAQDSFIKMYKSIAHFKGDAKFSTWLYKITYRTCLDQLRKQKREHITYGIEEVSERHLLSLDESLDHMERCEQNDKIATCISKLGPEDSFLVTLYYYKELRLDEIAEIVGLTVNNVKVKLFRCRKKLAKIMVTHIEPSTLEEYGK